MQISKRMMETTTYKRNATIEAKKWLYRWGKWVEGNFQNSFALIYIFCFYHYFSILHKNDKDVMKWHRTCGQHKKKLAPKEMPSYDCNPTESHRWLENRTVFTVSGKEKINTWKDYQTNFSFHLCSLYLCRKLYLDKKLCISFRICLSFFVLHLFFWDLISWNTCWFSFSGAA